MSLFGFNKRQVQEKKVSEYLNSTFGYVAKNSYCLLIKALNRVCSNLNCPAHFAFVAVQDAHPIGNYPTYTLKIVHGEINAWDNCGMLNYILSCNEDKRMELLQNRFALSEAEASAISGCGVQYGLDETSDSIVFSSDDVMTYLQLYLQFIKKISTLPPCVTPSCQN